MSKITIQHYLNTNLKAYLINGKKYYPIYLQVTAKRKTTKIRSLIFEEYYTEQDFEDIFSFNDENDKILVNNEIAVFENVAKLIIEALGDFDTTFYVKYLSFSNTISVWKPDVQILNFNNKRYTTYDENSIFGVPLDTLYLEIGSNIKEPTIFEFLNNSNQTKALKFISENTKGNAKEILNDINELIFYFSLDYFSYFLEANQKTRELKELYLMLFETHEYIITEKLLKKYGD
ncbi:hypothetical protein [Riemerella anatipestifer]|uniref:hypothetical protein n=1 Tax=Riemerella anatipestifer TaxID=34085 RepID=UPI000D68D396|nr:hypothetical protein [Riemerella anatipestifer]MBT0526007.1 hypothetical protein [Riemerella anatipestifer]MBT0527874.1 hypothetical protein [Riemerella anatipestifer]MBT0529914.1 hypothetical protein [Riemerella anatipestifer]MBT0531866.1 hypothetical protein [Riemerella anatipestifer]MBT0535569.1 hypothetical protein [Riemerella anatipestifer]